MGLHMFCNRPAHYSNATAGVNGTRMIEPISKLDIDPVFSLMKLNMESYYRKRNEVWNDERIRSHFLSQQGIVTRREGEIAGFSFFELKGARIHIHTLQVSPKFQNRTLGGHFYKWYRKLATEINADKITCGVYEDNPARNIYLRMGFDEIGLVEGVVRMSLPLMNTGIGRKNRAPLL